MSAPVSSGGLTRQAVATGSLREGTAFPGPGELWRTTPAASVTRARVYV